MKSLFGAILVLTLFVFLTLNPLVAYTLFVLSFLFTLYIRANWQKLEITPSQAEIFNPINTIIVFMVGVPCCLTTLKGDIFYDPKDPAYYQYIDHHSIIQIAIVIVVILVGLANIGFGQELRQYINKKMRDFEEFIAHKD